MPDLAQPTVHERPATSEEVKEAAQRKREQQDAERRDMALEAERSRLRDRVKYTGRLFWLLVVWVVFVLLLVVATGLSTTHIHTEPALAGWIGSMLVLLGLWILGGVLSAPLRSAVGILLLGEDEDPSPRTLLAIHLLGEERARRLRGLPPKGTETSASFGELLDRFKERINRPGDGSSIKPTIPRQTPLPTPPHQLRRVESAALHLRVRRLLATPPSRRLLGLAGAGILLSGAFLVIEVYGVGFHLDLPVLLALIGGTTANVIGLFIFVPRHLFRDTGDEKATLEAA